MLTKNWWNIWKKTNRKGFIMERFYFEIPSIERKEDAIDFIEEFINNNSGINGTGGLDRFVKNNDYEGWLEKLEKDYTMLPSEERVPARTYFLIRENDNKIVGMINIRLALNKKLKERAGHIGYGIRPTERKKGYNKINLYLGLKVCAEHEIEEVLLTASLNNPASWKTIESLGGVRFKECPDPENKEDTMVYYNIDVKKSLENYKEYEKCISNSFQNKKER